MTSTQEHHQSHQHLLEIVRRFSAQKLVIIGDSIADRFLYGAISRVSREAPVFILRHEQTETVPGGAANCAVNLASLGAHVSLISVVGNDEAGRALRERLESAGVDTTGIVIAEKLLTTTKVRILAGLAHSNKQQVIRVDYEDPPLADKQLHEQLVEELKRRIDDANAIVVSDYNYGVVNEKAIDFLRQSALSKGVPVLVDSRSRLDSFEGFTSATPNEDEVEHLLSVPLVTQEQLESNATELRTKLKFTALLVTRGAKGMVLIEEGVPPLQIDAVGAHQPVDVTGAGDTVIATFALSLGCGASFSDAARLANYAGGLVVMKRGTASITAAELENTIINSGDQS